jgi:Fur family ferric uptake transcriptional regulator
MRTNQYKKKVLALLKKNHLMSIADIHEHLSEANYTTIYRNVQSLVEEGALKKIVLGKDYIKYEIHEGEHAHDHFVCTDCGDVEELHLPRTDMQVLKNYKVNDLLVRGLCEDCNQNN